MANERRLIILDYDAVRKAFDEKFKETMQLIKNGETHLDNLAEGFTEADRVLREMPTVDAVDVVRCEECKYQEDCIGRIEFMGRNLVLELNTHEYRPLKFCSYGEKSGTQPQREDV